MRVIETTGNEDVALVYIADMGEGRLVEFVESVQPPIPRDQKWVLIISSLYGCPVKCIMCDAGGNYQGKLSKDEMLDQIDYMIRNRFPDGNVAVNRLKIQFARMGEPALNPAVIDVLEEIPERYNIPGFVPSISSIAPAGSEEFFDRLLTVKQNLYMGGRFQLQFSIHTTDAELRDKIVPVKKWHFDQIAEYAQKFHQTGDNKITLNFALAKGVVVDANALLNYFSPQKFLIKVTPINPTYRAVKNELTSYINASNNETDYELISSLKSAGYEVILSIGELEENKIGSNCGQYVLRHLNGREEVGMNGSHGYEYWSEVSQPIRS